MEELIKYATIRSERLFIVILEDYSDCFKNTSPIYEFVYPVGNVPYAQLSTEILKTNISEFIGGGSENATYTITQGRKKVENLQKNENNNVFQFTDENFSVGDLIRHIKKKNNDCLEEIKKLKNGIIEIRR